MKKDPTQFRERFKRWKEGKLVYENGLALPAYEDGLTPHKKSEVNTNEAAYSPKEDLYTAKYTLPEVTVTGDKKKVGTGYGKRLYMHPWKTVGDLIREQHEAMGTPEEQAKRAPYEKDLHKSLSPVDPVGEFVVGNAVLGPAFNYVGKGLKLAGNAIVDEALIQAGKFGNKWAKAKAVLRAMINPIVDDQFVFPGLIGWEPKQVFKGYHASNEATFKPDFFYNGWALTTHNAPYGIYTAEGTGPESGFLTKRPYVHQIKTTLDKPMVQIGEVSGRSKNSIRNQIERQAQQQGADGIIFRDIKDNQMNHLTIMKTLNPDTKLTVVNSRLGTPPIAMTDAQWDAAYNAAVKAGDIQEAQRLRDLHFKAKAVDNKLKGLFYHGTDKKWNQYDLSYFSSGSGDLGAWGRGLYLSNNKSIAQPYGKNIMKLYAYAKSPLEVKPSLEDYLSNPTEKAAYYFNRENIPSDVESILKDIDAVNKHELVVGDGWNISYKPYHEVVIPKGQQIKLTDVITYDDAGNIIPLSKRDNFNINDIRYGLVPWLIGAGTFGTLYGTSNKIRFKK